MIHEEFAVGEPSNQDLQHSTDDSFYASCKF